MHAKRCQYVNSYSYVRISKKKTTTATALIFGFISNLCYLCSLRHNVYTTKHFSSYLK